MQEIWKDIEGYEGLYQISNLGRIKSLERIVITKRHKIPVKETIRKQNTDTYGYNRVFLRNKNKNKNFQVHRLVAIHFIDNSENKPQVNHIDGVKTNNRVDNLEWVTNKENQYHSIKIGIRNSKTFTYKNQIIKDYLNGMGVYYIAKKYNITGGSSIYRLLKENNVKIRRRNNKIKVILKQLKDGYTIKQIAKLNNILEDTVVKYRSVFRKKGEKI